MSSLNTFQILVQLQDTIDGLYLCTQEPTTYAEATSTYAVGRKLNPTISFIDDHVPSGHALIMAAIADGEIIADGTATHWATTASDIAGDQIVWSSGSLAAGQMVVDGNSFTLTSFAAAAILSPT